MATFELNGVGSDAYFSEWGWDGSDSPISAAKDVIQAIIEEDCDPFIMTDDDGILIGAIGILGDMILSFPLREFLMTGMRELEGVSKSRKPWDDEVQSAHDFAAFLRDAAKDIDDAAEAYTAKGTLGPYSEEARSAFQARRSQHP